MSFSIDISTAKAVVARLKSYLNIDDAEACQIAGLARYERKLCAHRWVSETVVINDDEKKIYDEALQLARVMEGTDGDSVRIKLERPSTVSKKTYKQLLLEGYEGIREARKQLMSR